jgi:Fe-S-cluster containining protein
MSTPDCRRCGVCCFSASPTYVRVTGEDWSRLGSAAERLAYFVGHRAFMRMHEGHCSALEVRRTAAGQMDYFCSIYEQRPQLCRCLERGSPECAAEIERKGTGVAATCPGRGM